MMDFPAGRLDFRCAAVNETGTSLLKVSPAAARPAERRPARGAFCWPSFGGTSASLAHRFISSIHAPSLSSTPVRETQTP